MEVCFENLLGLVHEDFYNGTRLAMGLEPLLQTV
jgi:hypothetical protein